MFRKTQKIVRRYVKRDFTNLEGRVREEVLITKYWILWGIPVFFSETVIKTRL